MTDFPGTETIIDRQRCDVPKIRRCLRCKEEFPSQWSGERVCSRCKSTNAWRSGLPLKTSAAGNKR